MACTICTKSFGLFNKEHGCPVCKYSFCSGCLKYKLVLNGKKLNVCLRCSKLQANEPSTQMIPAGVQKIVATQYGHRAGSVDALPKPRPEQDSIPNDDDLIRSKLSALKTKDQDETTSDQAADTGCSGASGNTDIEKRLAALKGVEYKYYKNEAQRLMVPDNRTEQQQVQDLIGRYTEETTLNNVMDSKRLEQDDEIVKRLNALKESPAGNARRTAARPALPDSDSDDSVNDEEAARKLAERYVEEGKIAAKLNADETEDEILSPTEPTNDEEELPWCTICNEDAVLRCRGCDNDLYCKSCYREFHYDEDPREHTTEAFKPKLKKNS